MAAKVITIAQQKGGAGKTTVAAQLAVALSKGGKKAVALVDIDPQGSLSAWHAARCGRLGEDGGGIRLSGVAGWRLSTELDRLRDGADYVIVDSPPHAETEAKAAIRAADVILVPVQPSPMDLWATKPTLEVARKEKTPARVVLNRIPPRGKLVDQVLEEIQAMELEVTAARLGNRLPFASSMMEGLGVVETSNRSLAAQEIRALADEVKAIAKKGK
ncbi:Chromosome (plasmid) partitioning protein ParA [Caenispirillum salinarum AK4]|uniref:Chromosome (Plasmid) partitioning protein ParA n=1 Tax=Caenispirillum salinarum AK4 TaxID=1238182 RepID=K9HII9_9PROT|nr:ParA family partition ATPase [Caenispirillum salinarum]EKV28436.1 Chromosome (plasmid) partitioning protein ParA [Caenispirillum salinarum AK4]